MRCLPSFIMFTLFKFVVIACSAHFAFGASLVARQDDASVSSIKNPPRADLPVPSLTQIRDILSAMEAPIVSVLTERSMLNSDLSAYGSNGANLKSYLEPREKAANTFGRYDYGKLEYPFTLPLITPDKTTKSTPFPPGQFKQDAWSPNPEIFTFYIDTLVPLFVQGQSNSFFYHLDNSTIDQDAIFSLDATLLQLISARTNIGKIVAESKYAANVTGFTPLIKSQNGAEIRVLLTNIPQQNSVLEQAAEAAGNFSAAWVGAGAIVPDAFAANNANLANTVFNAMINMTTDTEENYMLQRLN